MKRTFSPLWRFRLNLADLSRRSAHSQARYFAVSPSRAAHLLQREEVTMATAHVLVGVGTETASPVVRRISPADLLQALRSGLDDFAACSPH